VSEPSSADAAPDPDAFRKERARLVRRVGQLEATLEQSEAIRDTNARLLDRVMGELDHERARSHELLLNVLPQPIIDRLQAGTRVIADRYDEVAIVFSDFVGFTAISGRLPVEEVVSSLNGMFTEFDAACGRLGVEKIKTVGDAYLAAAGLSGGSPDPARAAADVALAMRSAVDRAGPPWRIRIGVHQGPVVAGVIGTSKFAYDVWGDAVNVASRLETTAPPGGIQVSESIAAALGADFELEPRGEVELKGKGSTRTYLLVDRRAT
jgi:adenylate cyclase